jgi:hypothetical protein
MYIYREREWRNEGTELKKELEINGHSKNFYEKSRPTSCLMVKIEVFPPKIRNEERISILFAMIWEVLTIAIWQEKEMNGM